MRLGLTALAAAVGLLLLSPSAAAGPDEAFADEPDALKDAMRQIADEIDGQNVYDCIYEITHDFPYSYRLMGTPSQDLFIEKYGSVFEDLGLKSQIVPFNRGKQPWDPGEGPAGFNIIGAYEGRDPTKWVVIGGHYDTRELTMGGGAHDNGSGICTVKEVARAVATIKPDTEASWVFGWWDGEEWGLYGSVSFVEDHNMTKDLFNLTPEADVTLLQGISIDMAGLVYPANNPWAGGTEAEVPAPKQHFHLRAPPISNDTEWRCFSYGCYERLKERDDYDRIRTDFINYRSVVEEVWRNWLEVPEEHVSFEEDAYGRSDHVPFTAAGVPGLRVQGAHDDEYPCYHQPCDTLEFMSAAAGGEDLLVEGMDVETTTVGLISAYVALKGRLAPIGPPDNGTQPDGTALDQEGQGIPAPAGAFVALGLLGGALAWRRRR